MVLFLETFILVLMRSGTKIHGKNLIRKKNIDARFCASDYYDVNVNKYGLKCRTSLKFWENKDWINKIDPYRWLQCHFRYWLGRRSKDDERQINR